MCVYPTSSGASPDEMIPSSTRLLEMEQLILARLDRLEDMIKRFILTKKDWLTVAEFAEAARLHPKYVSELCKAGKIQAIKSTARHGPHFTWRIRQQELERYQREGQLMDN